MVAWSRADCLCDGENKSATPGSLSAQGEHVEELNQIFSLRNEIRQFLETVKDQDTDINTGSGASEGDLYVTVQGLEIRVTVAPG